MRMSTSPEDGRAYLNWRAVLDDYRTVEIYLDDVLIRDCVSADEEQGVLARYLRRPDWELQLNQAGDRILTEELHGRVEIRIVHRDLAAR